MRAPAQSTGLTAVDSVARMSETHRSSSPALLARTGRVNLQIGPLKEEWGTLGRLHAISMYTGFL